MSYTDKQKIAYYKALAAGKAPRKAGRKGGYRKRKAKATTVVVQGTGRYRARRRPYYRGRGDYIAEGVGLADKYLGTSAPRSGLGRLGGTAGDAISSFFGLGAYHVKQNVLMQDPLPVHNKIERGGQCCIRHREYIGDVITGQAGTFNLNSYSINPGQEATFPWLSQIAANYEQYRIEGMLFEFKSMSADALNSTNTALGQVIMATDYNAANPSFGQKAEMENYEFGSSAKPSESQIHMIECARSQTTITELYNRVNALPPDEDIRLYDLGNFQIATNGFQADFVNVGELWVTYQISFLKAKMFTALGNYNSIVSWSNGTTNNSVFPTSTDPFGMQNGGNGLTGVYFANTVPVVITSGTGGGLITFPPSQIVQTYAIQYVWAGNTGATGAVGISYTNCKPCPSNNPQSISQGPWRNGQYPTIGTSDVRMLFQVCIQTEAGGSIPTINVILSGNPPPGSVVTISIFQIPNQYSGLLD